MLDIIHELYKHGSEEQIEFTVDLYASVIQYSSQCSKFTPILSVPNIISQQMS